MTVQDAKEDGKELSPDQIFVRAVRIATNAHRGQTGKDGRPYIEHCERVAMRVPPPLRPIAYLHDVLEKADGWSMARLRLEGFPELLVDAVDALTRREGEDEEIFIRRAASNRLAAPVKFADLQDNLAQALAAGIDPSRYRQGLSLLQDLVVRSASISGKHARQ